METLEILREFCESNDYNKKIGKYIISQNPMRYEDEFGGSLIEWSDDLFMKLFIEKKGFYKMFSLGNVLSRYNHFFEWSMENGYISKNPFKNSMYLSYDYLIRAAVENGNVYLYSREYIRNCCYRMGSENAPYYLSVALSIFEGIRDYKSLSLIKYSDVDFKNRKIKGYENLIFSEELFNAYRDMHKMKSYKVENREQFFCHNDEFLIRRIIANGKDCVKNKNVQRNFSMKLKRVGINQSILYDSGVIDKLLNFMGKEHLLKFFFYEEMNKAYKTESNRKLEEVFKLLNINMSVRNFLYDYRVYALCLMYDVIKY